MREYFTEGDLVCAEVSVELPRIVTILTSNCNCYEDNIVTLTTVVTVTIVLSNHSNCK